MKRYLQRILACLTLCAILSGLLTLPASAAEFKDVPDSHWAAASIRECVELGFFNGETTTRFGVGHYMTRSAFAVVLCRFFGWETSTPTQTIYSDVPADAWYAGAIEAAYNHGAITSQRTDFRPADPITREDLTVALVRALGYGPIAGLEQDLENPFRDVTTNAGYITMAYHLGLVSGTSADTFSPTRYASREQVAVILMRLYDKLHKTMPQTIAMVTAPEDVEGAEIAAIPAVRLNSSNLENAMLEEDVTAALAAARQANLPSLLYVDGGSHALDSIDTTAEILISAVNEGGYDGLFLNLSKRPSEQRDSLIELTTKLKAALGDKPLYLTAEAPTRNNASSDSGYDYAALANFADQLVLHVAPYVDTTGAIPIAPSAPPEEIYYAMSSLREIAAAGKLSLMFSTADSFWSGKKEVSLSNEELQQLMADPETSAHYSERYATSYLIGTTSRGRNLVIWSLRLQDMENRLHLASLLGAHAVCLTAS